MDQFIISAILSLTVVAGIASLWTPISSLGRLLFKYLQKLISGPINMDEQHEKKRS